MKLAEELEARALARIRDVDADALAQQLKERPRNLPLAELAARAGKQPGAYVHETDAAYEIPHPAKARAPDPETAMLELIVPHDPTVRPQSNRLLTDAPLSGHQVHLADQLQILWDVARSTGIDAPQQTEHLGRHLLSEIAQGVGLT